MSFVPSGRQLEIRAGEQRASVVEVGASIRSYADGDRAVLDPFPLDRMADGAHGTPLIPWPNRLEDGRYEFAGEEHQVALSEPGTHNAIHGLLRWRLWTVAEQSASRVVMAARILPMMGYPFALDVAVAYALGADGLTVETTARNTGPGPCPYGCGQHPYLSPGEGVIDPCTLQVDAQTRILTDPERELPTGRELVTGTDFDFRAPRRLGEQRLDDSFSDLVRDGDGRAWIRLDAPDGRRAELWVDARYPFLELYTGDTLAPERARRGLGSEPMSCAPNAFRSGEGLVVLEPGESCTARWGARLA